MPGAEVVANIYAGKREEVLACLSKLDLSTCDEKGLLLLHHAAIADEDTLLIALVCEHGQQLDSRTCVAGTQQRNDRGMTALHYAVANNSTKVVRAILSLLKEKGKDVGVAAAAAAVLEAQNEWCESPLHLAASGGNLTIISLLLGAGASKAARDKWRRTPMKIAKQLCGSTEIITLLTPNKEAEEEEEEEEEEFSQDEEATMRRGRTLLQGALATEFLAKVHEKNSARGEEKVTVRHIFSTERELLVVPSSSSSSSSSSSPSSLLLSSSIAEAAVTPAASSCASSPTLVEQKQPPKPKMSLSKLLEYPLDPVFFATLLNSNEEIDVGGKDAFGLSALHKLVSWNDENNLALLLKHLVAIGQQNAENEITARSVLNATSGPPLRQTGLHMAIQDQLDGCVSMLLLQSSLCDSKVCDAKGLDALGYAKRLGRHDYEQLLITAKSTA